MTDTTRTYPGQSERAGRPIGVKCLLVDDREENLLALTGLLAGDDVEVITARSGVEALDLLLRHDFALALIDVQMPGMDGFELAELMRGNERTRHVPIIFVTAAMFDQQRVFAGYNSGAVDFLTKPIEPRILRNKADVFFQLYRQRQQVAADLRDRTETLRLNEMFTAVLGHDLRNPLSVILAGSRLLEKKAADDLARRTAARMASSALRMSRLIDDLLDMARARLAGGIPLKIGPLNLEQVLRRAVQEHETAHDQRVTVAVAGDANGTWDEDRLAQVLSNLLGNAATHGKGSGEVAIDVDGRDPDRVRLAVSNSGEIAPDTLPHLFNPFSRGNASRESGGLGLGLYIAKQIVEAHGGELAVCSDQGTTTFTLDLPRVSPAPSGASNRK